MRRKAAAVDLDTNTDPLVTVFSYDWRVSNADNALSLSKRVCDIGRSAPDSPIVIVAHSMGGLMTKIWAKRYSQVPCPDGKPPKLSRIVFVASPHLGSPKTIKAIAEGYNILFDEVTGLKRLLGFWERNHVLDAINEAGPSFASLYELLPIQTSQYCQKAKPSLAKISNAADGEDGKPINLFDVTTWRQYDLLHRIAAPAVRQVYYDYKLAPLLRQTEELLCDIVDFDPSTVAEIVYLYGREKDDRTYGWFKLKLGVADSIDKFTNVQGDGTVPTYSAQNFLVSRTSQVREVAADHVSIINHPVLRGLLETLYEEAAVRSKLDVARSNPRFENLLVAETAASGSLVPVSLNARAWTASDSQLAVAINKRALGLMGYSAPDVARFASLSIDPLDRAKLYAVAAAATDSQSEKLGWILEAAQSAYFTANFEDAIGSSEFIAEGAKLPFSASNPNAASLIKRAKEVTGWAYLRKGDIGKFDALATEYANTYAVTKNSFKEPTIGLPNYSPLDIKTVKDLEALKFTGR